MSVSHEIIQEDLVSVATSVLSGRATDEAVPDLGGEHYLRVLQRLHATLHPKTYLEVGVSQGHSLALARCPSIAVDPAFQITPEHLHAVISKPSMHFFETTSDDFFAGHSPRHIFGRPVDIAFLDGMHRCEFLLRDFTNVERHCKKNSVIVLHDCLPVEPGIAHRTPSEPRKVIQEHRATWWAGDVWRTSLLLRRRRPDLSLTVLDSNPTGLVLITNLDPASRMLEDQYSALVQEMLSFDLAKIGVQSLFAEMNVQSSEMVLRHEELTKHFWL